MSIIPPGVGQFSFGEGHRKLLGLQASAVKRNWGPRKKRGANSTPLTRGPCEAQWEGSPSRARVGACLWSVSHLEIRKDLFGEVSSRVLLSSTNVPELRNRAERMGLNFYDLGKVGGKRLILNYEGVRAIDVAIDELESAWREALPKLLS